MKKTNPTDRSSEKANATLDALLSKGVLADKRATKQPFPATVPPAAPTATSIPHAAPSPVRPHIARSNPALERLTVRFTQEEARQLEKARGVARAMGYKISDTAVFRLALNSFQPERLTPQALETVLAADTRRRPN